MSERQILEAWQSIADAYRNRMNRPPPPLAVPSWFIPLAAAERGETEEEAAAWLDAEARANGFDGYYATKPPAS